MDSLVLWVKDNLFLLVRIAAVAWVGGLVVILMAEMRWFQRLIPDWLRNLSRVVVLTGTVGVVTLAIVFGGGLVADSMQARTQGGDGPKLDLSFDSPNSFFLSAYLSMHQAELNQAVSDDPTVVTFVVEAGETATGVAARLEEDGLVVNGQVFGRFMAYHGLDVSLEAGTYRLRPNMTMHEIAETLQHGGADAVMVTIPEALGVYQTRRLFKEFARFGLQVRHLIINHVITAPDSRFLIARQKMQTPYIQQLQTEYGSHVEIIQVPEFPHEIKGIEKLKILQGRLFQHS